MSEMQAEPSEGNTETMREGRTETERATLELAGEQNEEASTSATGKVSGKPIKKTGTEARISAEDGRYTGGNAENSTGGGRKEKASGKTTASLVFESRLGKLYDFEKIEQKKNGGHENGRGHD